MTMDPVLKSRVRNVVLALLALGLMCALPTAMSFVLAFVLTMLFTAIVMLAMRGKLRKIDMVESLKSVE